MSLIAVNDLPATDARIVLPRVGVWHARVLLAASVGIEAGDAVTVEIGDSLTLTGTARRAGVFVDALQVQIVGGAGGFSTRATAKAYKGAAVNAVVSDLLDAAGERLDASTDAALLATLLPAWQTLGRPVGVELQTLLGSVSPSSVWRVTTGGRVWAGSETWPESDAVADVLERDERTGRLALACEVPTLLPGTTLDGERVGDVEHAVTAHEVVTVAWVLP